ncbi:2OG-Fe(II) oxygenase superfamily-domain-containing protein [Mycena leptocephala]|nr:2OG-Fe(II) oxygenase superfamily-domain-containing protein [Mycena leptocephala]
MRAPTSLEDKNLLEDEPFASSFSGRQNGPKKQMVGPFLDKIVDMLEKQPGAYRAVDEWRRLAFIQDEFHYSRGYKLRSQESNNYRTRSQRNTKKPTMKILKCFVKFYWYLFCGQDAMKFLRSQKFGGYINMSCLDDLPIKEEPIDESMSPLSELSDGVTTWPSANPVGVESSVAIEIPSSGLGLELGGTSTPGKVQESATSLVLPLPETISPALSFLVASRSPHAAYKRSDSSAPESESIPSLRTPVRPRLPQISAPSERRALLPAHNGTSPLLLRDDKMLSDMLGHGPELATSSEAGCLPLLDLADAPENWLTLPAIETTNESDELPVFVLTEARNIPKPTLQSFPPMWAKARQEVCESLEWFRSYQGGVYQNNGTVKGYFLSAFSASMRDCFECGGKIIISHGGGKAESARSQNGQTTKKVADDQRAGDLSVRGLIENYRHGQPLVLLIDDKYGPFPFDLGEVYMAVLGFYKIIHMWAEYQPSNSNANGRVVRYKFAFQWCEGQPVKTPNLYFPCSACGNTSPRVFREWACLHPTCSLFWIMPSGGSLPLNLDYNPDFLTVIDFRPLPFSFRDALLPKPLTLAPKDGITTSYTYSRGWHCRKCGRLSCRSDWEQYQCPHCKDTQKIVGNVRSAKMLMSMRVPISNKFVDSLVDDWSGIKRLPTKLFNHPDIPGATGRYQTFELPDGKGKIHLIQTNRLVNIEADRIFEAYQQQASDGTLLFRRWPLRSHKLRGPLLTNYFSQIYVGGTDNTVPFDRAPGAVVQARELIEKRIREALGVEYKFNEVLSAAYMEQQKMAFHSDSEKGLGPVVAGLSMGSPALMHFRLLTKYVSRTEQRANAMTVVLRHGDVLVMEGAGVQDFYE